LEEAIRSNEKEDHIYNRYFVSTARTGLELLRSGRVDEQTVLLSVGIRRESGDRAVMNLWFFDGGFRTRGVVVRSGNGFHHEYEVFDWSDEARQWYSTTVLRNAIVDILLEGHMPGAQQPLNRLRPTILLPEAALGAHTRVALLTDTGKEVSSVTPCIFRTPE
jgi:hypothetical protein